MNFGRLPGHLFWLSIAVIVGWLWWNNEVQQDHVPALVETKEHSVGPTSAGRISSIFVVAGDEVKAGDAVASLECADTHAKLAIARAQLSEISAEILAITLRSSNDSIRRRAELEAELGQAEASVASAVAEQQAREAELGVLNKELKHAKAALEERLTRASRLTELRARQTRLARQARHSPKLIDAWEESASRLKTALAALREDGEVGLAPLRARTETQSQRIGQLLGILERCTLRSPIDGHIAQVLHRNGDSIVAGDIVAVVVSPRPESATAYLPERRLNWLRVGQSVRVVSQGRPSSAHAVGVIENIGVQVVQLPPRLWENLERPQYGRSIHIRLSADTQLMPGETARVGIISNAAHAATGGQSVREAEVPAELSRQTRLEISGALWLDDRQRFLLISDDTGFASDREHIPWAFTSDSKLKFDPEPLLIDGIDKISDMEALARSPAGHIFILASQSASKQGKRPRKRQWLLRTSLDGQVLKVTGALLLFSTLRSQLDIATRDRLGIDDQWDVEGMTWFKEGLLLGIKSPQDSSKRSRVLRIRRIDAAMDRVVEGKEAKIEIDEFARWSLPTCRSKAAGGISGLHRNGNILYLTSTLPYGPPCGSAWRVDMERNPQTPERLAQWEGLKPEGIVTESDQHLLIVFDTNGETPRFTRIDLLSE